MEFQIYMKQLKKWTRKSKDCRNYRWKNYVSVLKK
jgi:hypothetical protein